MSILHNVLHRDGTSKVYVSPATPGQFLTFTSKGDDIENKIIGGGPRIFIKNPEGSLEVQQEIQFLEDVQLKDAYIFWENALPGDFLTGEVVLPANTPFLKSTKTGNADFVDGVIKNITTSTKPDKTWVGSYILFPVDVPIVRFLNDMPLFGSNNKGTVLRSPGVALINKELKQRLIYKRYDSAPNKNINISILLETYRKNTL